METSCIAKMANLINYSTRVTFSVYYACNCISLAFPTLLVFIKIKQYNTSLHLMSGKHFLYAKCGTYPFPIF